MSRKWIVIVIGLILCVHGFAQNADSIINIVYISDVHYGLFRQQFRGKNHVSSKEVNGALIKQINSLTSVVLPGDSGVLPNKRVDCIEALVITGDITNREQAGIQSATKSWKQFKDNYMDGLHARGSSGKKAELLLTPGNHDASNAVGYYKKMVPGADSRTMFEIYNHMMKPIVPLTTKSFDYYKNAVNYSRDIGGIHFVFPPLWLDSAGRMWLEED